MIGNGLKIIQWLYGQKEEKIFEIKEYKEKRNKDQNSKYYKLLNELALKLKISKEELHFQMLKSYSSRYEILVPANQEIRGIEYYEQKSTITRNGKEFNVYHVFTPSHELKTDEFAVLLQGLCDECKQQGIDTRSPEEILIDNQITY